MSAKLDLDLQPLLDEFRPYGPGFLVWWLLTDRIRWLKLYRLRGTDAQISSCRRERREWSRKAR